jgi:hypothetical protein
LHRLVQPSGSKLSRFRDRLGDKENMLARSVNIPTCRSWKIESKPPLSAVLVFCMDRKESLTASSPARKTERGPGAVAAKTLGPLKRRGCGLLAAQPVATGR